MGVRTGAGTQDISQCKIRKWHQISLGADIKHCQSKALSIKKGVHRPFGDAEIDFFIEHGPPDHYDELARRLWSFNKGFRARTPVQLSATPRCKYSGVVGRINVRLYGDSYCAAHWRQEWDKWAAAYSTRELYVGLPASEKVAGYVHPRNVFYGVVPVVKKAASYDGFMVWDRYSDQQTNYSSYLLPWA